MQPAEPAKHRRQLLAGRILGGTQPDFAGELGQAEMIGRLIMQGYQPVGIRKEAKTIRCRGESIGSLDEDGAADAFLQPGELMAERGSD